MLTGRVGHNEDSFMTFLDDIETRKASIIHELESCGIIVHRYNLIGNKGLLVEFPNGNRVGI